MNLGTETLRAALLNHAAWHRPAFHIYFSYERVWISLNTHWASRKLCSEPSPSLWGLDGPRREPTDFGCVMSSTVKRTRFAHVSTASSRMLIDGVTSRFSSTARRGAARLGFYTPAGRSAREQRF